MKMDRLIITQGIKMIKTYYKNGGWCTAIFRKKKKNFFSDEEYFTLGEYVNKQSEMSGDLRSGDLRIHK